MSKNVKDNPAQVFNALQQIISSIERISGVVHQITDDQEIRKKIDKDIEVIAEQCVTISESLGSSTTTSE